MLRNSKQDIVSNKITHRNRIYKTSACSLELSSVQYTSNGPNQGIVSRATPLNQKGERGLVTACTASCSATRSCRVQSDSVILSHDLTSLICGIQRAPRTFAITSSCTRCHQTSLLFDWGVWRARLIKATITANALTGMQICDTQSKSNYAWYPL